VCPRLFFFAKVDDDRREREREREGVGVCARTYARNKSGRLCGADVRGGGVGGGRSDAWSPTPTPTPTTLGSRGPVAACFFPSPIVVAKLLKMRPTEGMPMRARPGRALGRHDEGTRTGLLSSAQQRRRRRARRRHLALRPLKRESPASFVFHVCPPSSSSRSLTSANTAPRPCVTYIHSLRDAPLLVFAPFALFALLPIALVERL
jgi:hypothetical protein